MRNGCDYCFHSEQNAERTRSNFDNQASPWERVGLLRFPFVGVPSNSSRFNAKTFPINLLYSRYVLELFVRKGFVLSQRENFSGGTPSPLLGVKQKSPSSLRSSFLAIFPVSKNDEKRKTRSILRSECADDGAGRSY